MASGIRTASRQRSRFRFLKSRSAPLGSSVESSNAETGTGGAYAPLSEILPAARVARSVRMTEVALAPLPQTLRSRCSLRQDWLRSAFLRYRFTIPRAASVVRRDIPRRDHF